MWQRVLFRSTLGGQRRPVENDPFDSSLVGYTDFMGQMGRLFWFGGAVILQGP